MTGHQGDTLLLLDTQVADKAKCEKMTNEGKSALKSTVLLKNKGLSNDK